MRTGVPRRVRVAALAALLLAAGCGGDDDSGDGADGTGSASPGSARPTTTVPAASIGTRDFAFQPATVAPGVVVRLANADSSAHTVESRDGAWTFDAATQTFTAPSTPGDYAVFCSIHTSMAGTLTVA